MARAGSRRGRTSSCPSRCSRACSGGCCWRCWPRRTRRPPAGSSATMPASPTAQRSSASWRRCARTKWVVYTKEPFARPEQVLRYLSRYTHRVAISNRRLVVGRRRRRRLPLEGLPHRRARPLEDDDADAARVHPPLPDARAAEGLPPHPPLRPASPTAIAPTTSPAPASCSVLPPRVQSPRRRKPPQPDEPRVLPCPCPRCGGRMIIIEVFARGCEPKYRPAPAPTPIRIDTS